MPYVLNDNNIAYVSVGSGTDMIAGKNIIINNNVINCDNADSNFVYGENVLSATSGSNQGNFLVGRNNKAEGRYLYENNIFGYNNHTSGSMSYEFIAGNNNTNIGDNNYNNNIFGGYNKISGDNISYETVVGYNNSADGKTSYGFIVGSDNIVSGSNYNNIGMSVFGVRNTVNSEGSTNGAIVGGLQNTATFDSYSDASIVLGQRNNVSGHRQYGIGTYNNISGEDNFSIGYSNTISGANKSMNIGYDLNNTSTSSIKIGYSSACYIEVTPSGIYKVINGVRTAI